MKYYKYVRDADSLLAYKAHIAVMKCKPLAISKYQSRWEDALDDAYFHIMEHYNEAQGSLEHYALSVVSTIFLNKYPKEVGSDTVFDIESNKEAVKSDELDSPFDSIAQEEDIEYDSVLKQCVQYLLPLFIKDYELFHSKDCSTRKMSYTGLFDKFPVEVIAQVFKTLGEEYYEEGKYINNLSKECHMCNFSADRYRSSLDKTISYSGRIGDIVKCKSIGVKRKKYLYDLNISDLCSKIYNMFYDIGGVGSRLIYGINVFCSLSGNVYFSKDDLFESLEREIIGSVLAMRTNLKVLHYDRGKEMIFTSTRDDEPSVALTMFKTKVLIPLTRLFIGKLE